MFANEGEQPRATRSSASPKGTTTSRTTAATPRSRRRSRQINRFHVEQFAYLLGKLKSIQEGDGTLLDHWMIVYGSGISDGNRHNHNDLPILLAGKGGGTIRTGRHVKYDAQTPLNNLYLSLLDRMGVKIDRLGTVPDGWGCSHRAGSRPQGGGTSRARKPRGR